MMISSMVMIYMPVILMRFKSMFMAIYNNIIYYRSNKLTLEGIHCVMQAYGRCNSQNIFSVRFRALWDYIQQYQHDTIYSIKEYPSCGEGGDSDDEDNDQNNNNNDGDVNKKRNNDIFIVNQHTPFKLDDDIMCKVICVKEDFDKKQNGDKNTARDITILNSGAALYVSGICSDFESAFQVSRKMIDEGHALNKLNQLIKTSNE